MTSEGAVESGVVEVLREVEVLFVFVLFPDCCGFWVKLVTIDETIVVCWLFAPVLTMVDKKVEVTTTGVELPPPPDEAGEVELLPPLDCADVLDQPRAKER